MRFAVFISEDAERDTIDIYDHISRRDSTANARRVLDAIDTACRGLSMSPERGNVPKELRAIGISEFRELHSGPYRAIYRTFGRRVVVYCVVDGRRDMESLLRRRLLR
ncbi:MAG TPA: type II toxin-antitoxin system RelE/ParE family toxin [Stellaceae bacterium]|nr:type II toxin-antitoxin system RelE/ParE family toxin [Stellaceae bacterium]